MSNQIKKLKKLRAKISELHTRSFVLKHVVQMFPDKHHFPSLKNQMESGLNAASDNSTVELLDKVNEWCSFQQSGTDDYKMGIIMKAAALRLNSSLETTEAGREAKLREAVETVEQFKGTPEGLYPYVNSMLIWYQIKRDRRDTDAYKILFKANEVYEKFIETNNKEGVWDYPSIFSGEPPSMVKSDEAKKFFRVHLGYSLYAYYKHCAPPLDLKEGELVHPLVLKYIMPGMEYLEGVMSPARTCNCLSAMANMLKDLLRGYRLKQLDHCLAGLMFQLTKYRRSIPASEHKAIIQIQFKVAQMFTLWGAMVIKASKLNMRHPEAVSVDNDNYVELKLFQEPGVEIYAHQFPIQLVNSIEELKLVAKRVKGWDKNTALYSAQSGLYQWDAKSHEFLDEVYKLL